MADYYVKAGDDTPVITAVLQDLFRVPVNLTGASVAVHLRPTLTATGVINGAGTVDADQNLNRGKVTFTLPTGGLLTVGEYLVEWEVTFSTGKKQTFPNGSYSILEVVPQLA